jgi:hypothetical protein
MQVWLYNGREYGRVIRGNRMDPEVLILQHALGAKSIGWIGHEHAL